MNSANDKLCIKLEEIWQDFRRARISTKELIHRLDELKNIAEALEQLDPTPKNCRFCDKPMYKHHMCDDD